MSASPQIENTALFWLNYNNTHRPIGFSFKTQVQLLQEEAKDSAFKALELGVLFFNNQNKTSAEAYFIKSLISENISIQYAATSYLHAVYAQISASKSEEYLKLSSQLLIEVQQSQETIIETASLFCALGSFKIAKCLLEDKSQEDNKDYFYLLGSIQCIFKEYKEGLNSFQKAYNLGAIKAIHKMGVLYLKAEKNIEAEHCFLIAFAKRLPMSTNTLFQYYEKQGLRDIAQKYLTYKD